MELTVSSIVCEVCAGTVKKAIVAKDPNADVAVDLETKKVTVNSTMSPETIKQAIIDAGHEVSEG